MRTKTLFVAAAISVAGLASSLAQSNVYSVNVVGYVNTVIPPFAFALLANPLTTGTNSLKQIISTAPDNAQVSKWDPLVADLVNPPATFVTAANDWDYGSGPGVGPAYQLAPGQAFFFFNPDATPFTITFVGEVLQGAVTNFLLGNFAPIMIGSKVPIGGNITNVLAQYVPADNDQIQKWDPIAADFPSADISTYVLGTGLWVPNSPPEKTFNVGEGFLMIRTDVDVNYVRNFTVQ